MILSSLLCVWKVVPRLQINSRSIQDMHIFGDPSRIPIVIVERAVNAPLRSTSGNSFFSNLDRKSKEYPLSVTGLKSMDKLSGANEKQNGRVLKIVVFVHGFQACFIIFIFLCIGLFCTNFTTTVWKTFHACLTYFSCWEELGLVLHAWRPFGAYCMGVSALYPAYTEWDTSYSQLIIISKLCMEKLLRIFLTKLREIKI